MSIPDTNNGTDLVRREDEHYRRGVVLGLTMAEIVILIIFCLLLALVTLLRQKETEISNLAASQKIYAMLQETAAKMGNTQLSAEEIPEYFRELILDIQKVATLEAENAQLKERNQALEQLADQAVRATGQPDPKRALEQIAHVASALDAAIARNVKGEMSPSKRAELIGAASEAAAEIIAQDFAAGAKPGEERPNGLEALAKNREEGARLRRENQDLQSQVRTLLAKNIEGGKGTEKPSCWYVQGTTRPEYIFDVSLESNGITAFDNDLPHRATEKAALPINMVRFNSTVSIEDFLAMMQPLLQWSDNHDPPCRFFVRVYDDTGLAEKVIYKKHLNTVEQRFYKFESPTPRFAPANAGVTNGR